MNINMRIITEDNIDKISTMSFSSLIDNISDPKIKKFSDSNQLEYQDANVEQTLDANVEQTLDANVEQTLDDNLSRQDNINTTLKEFEIIDKPKGDITLNKKENIIPEKESSFVKNLYINPETNENNDSQKSDEEYEESKIKLIDSNLLGKRNTELLSEKKLEIPINDILDSKLKDTNIEEKNEVIIVDDPNEEDILENEKFKTLTNFEEKDENSDDDQEKGDNLKKSIIIN